MRYVVSLVVVLVPALSGIADDTALQQAWAKLFSQEKPAAASDQIEAVLAACNHDAEKVKALIASDTSYPAMKAAWHRRRTRVQAPDKAYDVEFLIRVPAGYTPKKSWPLLLVAHGKGANGGHMMAAFDQILGSAIEQFIVVAPTMPGPQGFNAQAYQQQSYLKPLAWSRAHLNVDDDRIYLSGYSQGGHLTWNLSAMFPYHFAATVPMAGAPIFEGFPATATSYLQNLWNLPVWAVWGELDKPKPPKRGNADFCRVATQRLKSLRIKNYRGTELKGKGHGDCWPNGKKMVEFFLAHKRVAVPEKYWHYFHLPHQGRSYYVEALKLSRPPIDFVKGARIVLPRGVEPTTENIRREYEKKVQAVAYRIYAMLDRRRNTLRVYPLRISSIRLYVMAGMFDLSKPVRLAYFTRSWRGKIPVSAKCMLTHYAATRDATAPVYNEIDLSATGKVVIRHK